MFVDPLFIYNVAPFLFIILIFAHFADSECALCTEYAVSVAMTMRLCPTRCAVEAESAWSVPFCCWSFLWCAVGVDLYPLTLASIALSVVFCVFRTFFVWRPLPRHAPLSSVPILIAIHREPPPLYKLFLFKIACCCAPAHGLGMRLRLKRDLKPFVVTLTD